MYYFTVRNAILGNTHGTICTDSEDNARIVREHLEYALDPAWVQVGYSTCRTLPPAKSLTAEQERAYRLSSKC
jgi:hypothetical protein